MKTEKTIPTIDEMNEVIALYMGGINPRTGRWYNLRPGGYIRTCNLSYHSDWNEIHRVWNKVGEEMYRTVDRGNLADYSKAHGITLIMIGALQKSDIQAAHESLYESITYLKEKGEK